MENTITTATGERTPEQIMRSLIFISYATQRDLGMSVAQCKNIGFNADIYEPLYQKQLSAQ